MKEKVAQTRRKLLQPKHSLSIAMMLIIVVGVAGSMFAAFSEYNHLRNFLLGRAVVIADALPPDDVAMLRGNSSDLNNPAYTRIKERLQQILRHNQDLKYVYILGLKDDRVFFHADSEVPTSDTYSPPGKVYADATQADKNAFSSDQAFTEGPVGNRWSAWMSGVAPIIDPETGKTIAVAGVDTPAVGFFFEVGLYALIPLILAAIPLAGLIRDRKLQAKEYEIMELKDEFVSIASHELRSPLNGMLWAIQSLLKTSEKNMTKEQTAMLTDMYRSTASSIATINEILDLSIFTRGHAKELQREQVDLVSMLGEIVKTLKLGADERLATLELQDFPAHVYVVGDLGALKRSFMNIVSNAIKYTEEKSTISIKYESKDAQHLISIADHGIGIPKSEQAKIFEGYYRASNATKKESQGTGLGLWVTKLAVEEHGGKIWLTSEVNKGTTVFIQLPKSASNATAG